jgi:hypothetical protein
VIRTLPEAQFDLEEAQAAVYRLDEQMKRVEADGQRALLTIRDLRLARDSGNVADPVLHAVDLAKAQAEHDAVLDRLAELARYRAPLKRRLEDAEMDRNLARTRAAQPEADRLEAESRGLFEMWAEAQLASLRFRRDNGIRYTGMFCDFSEAGNGLRATLRRMGLSEFFGFLTE